MNFLEIEQNIENTIEKIERKFNLDFLRNMESKLEEIYVLDRFEGNIAILENRESKELIEIEKDSLPTDIKEGDILNKINDKFIKNLEQTEEISERIKNKMDDLWE